MLLNKRFKIRNIRGLIFNMIIILFINIIGLLFSYNIFLIYFSLILICYYVFKDINSILKESLFDIRFFLLTGTIFWYFIPLLIGKISNIEMVNVVIINYSLSLIFVSKKFKVVINKENLTKNNYLILFLIIVYTIFKIYSINENIFIHILNSRESENYTGLNLNSSIFDSIISAIDILYYLIVSFGLYKSFINRQLFLIIFFTILIVFISIETGFRTLMIFLLFPVLFFLLSQSKFLKIGLSVLILLLFAKFILLNRNETNDIYNDLNAFDAAIQTSDLYTETEYAFQNIYKFKNSKQNEFYLYATFLVPRSIFPLKPIPGVIRDYTLVKWNQDILFEAGNVFPGIYMNFYLTYGFLLGIIIFIFFQYFILFFFTLIYRNKKSVFFLSLYCANLFLNFRSNSPLFYFYVIVPYLILTLQKSVSTKNEIP